MPVCVQHADLRVSNGAPDGCASVSRIHPLQRRPDRGFRGAVQVPHFSPGGGHQLFGQIRRQSFPSAEQLQPRSSSPAGLERQTPRHRRGLHHGDSFVTQQAGEGGAIEGGGAWCNYHLCATDQWQIQLEPGDVEGESSHSQQSIR
jgi:hypothetical protein